MLCIISKETFGEHEIHSIQTNSSWTNNPYEDYVIVPEEMVEDIFTTKGICDIVLNDEGTEVVSFVARDIPEPEPEPVTEMEQLRADVDYIAVMTGVEL